MWSLAQTDSNLERAVLAFKSAVARAPTEQAEPPASAMLRARVHAALCPCPASCASARPVKARAMARAVTARRAGALNNQRAQTNRWRGGRGKKGQATPHFPGQNSTCFGSNNPQREFCHNTAAQSEAPLDSRPELPSISSTELTRPRGVFRLFRHMVRAVASAACLLALLPWCAARVSAPGLSRIDTTLTRQVDGALDRALGKGGLMDRTLGMAETGIASLRAKVREDRLPRRSGVPVTFDAALAGCAAGYLCGKVVVGDPLFLAAAGAVGSAVATRWPEPDGRGSRTAGSVVVGSAYRGARCVAQLRAVVVAAWRRQ